MINSGNLEQELLAAMQAMAGSDAGVSGTSLGLDDTLQAPGVPEHIWQEHLDEASKRLSPDMLTLYLTFANRHFSYQAYKEMVALSQEKSYDYNALLSRIVEMMTRLTPEQQEYVLYLAFQAAAQGHAAVIMDEMQKLVTHKRSSIAAIANILRVLEPYLVRAAQRVVSGKISNKEVEDYIRTNRAMIDTILATSESLWNEAVRLGQQITGQSGANEPNQCSDNQDTTN